MRKKDRTGKRKKKAPLPLVIVMTVLAFLILMVTMIFVITFTYGLMRLGIINSAISGHMAMTFILIQFGIASIFVGTAISFLVVRIPLRPVNKLIEAMDRLAEGDYQTRLHLGEHRLGKKLETSFNKLAEELGNTEMLRSDFVNNFSHEFKTPIVSIYGFAKLLRRGHVEEEQAREYISIIEQESGRLADMATNVLNLTKVENQMILTDVKEYNLSEQIRRCVLLLEKKWSAKDLEISCEFNEHMITANEEMLQQVWINLLDNAIKFSPESGKVTIWVQEKPPEKEGRYPAAVTVAVKNTGPASREEDRERIFHKFYQADTSHASQGTGVGLAVVKKIVELHRGSVWVESTETATTFRVELPRGQEGI